MVNTIKVEKKSIDVTDRVVKVLKAVNMIDTVKVEKKDEIVETVNAG